jgi:RHS repeat-associated protein
VPFLSLLPNGDKRYRIQDNVGSTRVVLTADGSPYDWNEYEPFGTILRSGGGQYSSDRLSYIGKERDSESDLGDFGVRKYEAETGRFLSTDPLWEEQRPWNVYHYSANNPIVAKDPDGKIPLIAVAVVAIAYFLSSPSVAVAPTRDTQGDKAKVEQAKRNSQQNAAIVTTTVLTGGGALSIASGLATGGEVSVGKGLGKSGNKPSQAKSGRGKNHLKPDGNAKGEHSTFRRNDNGEITNYTTYEQNPKNPSGFQEVKRVDVTGDGHKHTVTREVIPTPHVHEQGQKNPRAARNDELPKKP